MLAFVTLLLLSYQVTETKSLLEREPAGWIDLVADAGPTLKGWSRGPIPPTGKLDPDNQWSIDTKTGHLLCQGDKGHEWLRFDKEMADFVYHVEWKFTEVEGKKGYNSGIYVRNSADATVWHQAQTGAGTGGFIFGETMLDGKLQRVNFSKEVTGKPVKPPGEWNTFEITCKGKEVTLWVNGAITNVWKNCEVPKGHVGLEAEGYRIEFRNVKVKPL